MIKTKTFPIKFKDPSGNEVSTEFTLRRPTIGDRVKINAVKRTYSSFPEDIDAENTAIVLATIDVLSERKPDWFKINEIDETFLLILTKIYLDFIKWRDSESYSIIKEEVNSASKP